MSVAMPSRRSEGATFLQPRSASFYGSIQSDAFSLNRLRFSSLGLYGREKETSLLQEVYEGVISGTTGKAVVMLSGYTGTGKSSIVKKFQDDVQRDNRIDKKSFFAAGKFDLHRRAEPYTALITAYTQLGDNILSLQRDDTDVFFGMRDLILEKVGSEGGVLRNIMPNIIEILGEENADDSDCDSEYEIEKNRFNFILRQFVHAVSTQAYPIVLFLDDLQWADAASLEVIDVLMTDSQLSGILLVGCYRENEVDESHPLAIRLRGFGINGDPPGAGVDLLVSHLHVDNLVLDAVHTLITDALNVSDKTKTLALATCVHRKTLGNVFFVIQFLMMLQDEGLLVYSFGAQDWKWDDEEISSSTRAAGNVVDLLQTKLRERVSLPLLKILQLSSCLGASFDKSTLILVAENLLHADEGLWSDTIVQKKQLVTGDDPLNGPTFTVEEGLRFCVNEGFFEVSGEAFYFAHDQIQSAAYDLIPDDKKNLFQLRIGEVLLDYLSEDKLDSMLFVVVDLLNNGVDLVTTDARRTSFARLNLQAGKKSMESSAFASASSYLTTGIRLLNPDILELDNELRLDLINTAMKAEYCRGNFVQVRCYADKIIRQRDKPIESKLSAYAALMQCLGDEGRPAEALDLCLSVLAQLGVRFPLLIGKASFMSEFWKTKRLLKKHPLSSLSNLPVLKDKRRLNAMKFISECGTYAMQAKTALVPLLVFRNLQWSIRYGVCQYSPIAFAGYGLLAVAGFGNPQEAYAFGNFALSLSDRLGAKKAKSFSLTIYNMSICHWVETLQATRKALVNGYQLALQTGDINHAMMNICHFCSACFAAGEPLTRLEADLRVYCKQMKEYDQIFIFNLASVIWQTVLNLMSRSKDPIVLTGEAMDQDLLLKICGENKMTIVIDGIKAYQLQLAFLFECYDLASRLVAETRNVAKTHPGKILVWRTAAFEGLVGFVMARQRKRRRRWKRFALNVVTRVRQWVSKGNVNCLHTLYLLEAEKDVLCGKRDAAK